MFHRHKCLLIVTVLFVGAWRDIYRFASSRELHQYKDHRTPREHRTFPRSFRLNELKTTHANRLQHMQAVCIEHGNEFAHIAKKQFLYSPKYNFHFCSIAKIGSTFWQKVVRILEHGVQSLGDLLYKKRAAIHKEDHKYREDVAVTQRNNATTVMISRNPYSRLYSAYVDKVFLNQSNICTEPTFKTFLRNILNANRIPNNNHIRPVSATCDPCALKPRFLLKQETFTNDVLYFLHKLNISETELNTISDLLFKLRTENNVPGIVETVYRNSFKQKHKTCFRWRSVAKRLWTSFQIQGYIDERVNFPNDQYKTNDMYRNSSVLIEAVYDSIRRFPLTESEIQAQRARALVRAYSNIKDELIRKIQRMYILDFKFFNYSRLPPSYP